MNRILVPTDFSACAATAVESALNIARPFNAEVVLINVVESLDIYMQQASMTAGAAGLPAIDYGYLAPFLQDLIHANTEKMKVEVEKQQSKLKNIRGIVVEGIAHQTVCDYALEHNFDLIVMGTHGAKGIQEIFIGSNTQRVVRNAKIPVLTVKSNEPIQQIDSIAFVSAFESEDLADELVMIQSIAAKFHAKIDLVYINTPGNFERSTDSIARMNDFVAANWKTLSIDSAIVFNDFSVEEGVANFVSEKHPSLVVIFTHGRKGVNRMMHYNITETLVNHIQIPILCNHYK